MKKSAILPLILGLVFTTSCLVPVYSQASDERDLSPFEGIGISIHADVYYTQGNSHQIRIEGNEKDVRDLITEVKDGFLQVKYDDWKIKRDKLTIYITSKELNSVKVAGSAHVMAKENVDSEEMDLALSGSGEIIFGTLHSEEIDVKISGSGSVELQGGEAEELGVKISGSGKLLAEDFNISECDASISGSGNAKVSVSDEIQARISGSGKVYYKGDPQVNSVTSGSGKVVSM